MQRDSEKLRQVDVVIAGFHKAGTTSLKSYLSMHPDVVTHPQPEMSYFLSDPEYERGYDDAFERYLGHQKDVGSASIVLAKHASLVHWERGMRRLKSHNPDCKILLIARDPVSRAYSEYLMETRYEEEERPFKAIVHGLLSNGSTSSSRDERIYLEYGIYASALETARALFGVQSVELVVLERLVAQPGDVIKRLLVWMGVDPTIEIDTSQRHNVASTYRSYWVARFTRWLLGENNPVKQAGRALLPSILQHRIGSMLRAVNSKNIESGPGPAPEVVAELRRYFEPHNRRLGELIGAPITEWEQSQ